ncbi:MAG: hypothetical protein JW959_09295 [Pirellulales bacterium]|nr:hypothetical protein [Pirellulales bacterium]
MECLEQRMLLAAAEPTGYEQYLLELINRGRLNPAAEASQYGIDLNQGLASGTISADPKQPLAFSPALVAASRGHTQWMIATDMFDHKGKGGSEPDDRMKEAGYHLVPPCSFAENIAYYSFFGMIGTTEMIYAELFASPQHRKNQMNASFREAGVGLAQGDFAPDGYSCNALVATEDFAYSGSGVYLTGVVYDDRLVRTDQFYTPGEGLGGVTIKATRKTDGAIYSTTSWASGGYTLQLPAGDYAVVATGGALGARIAGSDVKIGSRNVKMDFMPTQAVEPVAVIDLSIVRTPTATDSVGEVDSLPSSETWIDEWDAFWVEIWVSTSPGEDLGVASAQVDLAYNTGCFTPTAIEYGSAFTQDQTGTIDDGNGVVHGLGAGTSRVDAGDDGYVLLARVRLDSVLDGDAAGLPVPENSCVTACPCGVAIDGMSVTLVDNIQAKTVMGTLPATELWPVAYDLDDNGWVGLGDLSYFAAAYGKSAGEPGVSHGRDCDFDGNGEIGLGDLSYFAAAYRLGHGDPGSVPMPFDFPSMWRSSSETATDVSQTAFIVAAPLGDIQDSKEMAAARDEVFARDDDSMIESTIAQRYGAWMFAVDSWRPSRRNDGTLPEAIAIAMILADSSSPRSSSGIR